MKRTITRSADIVTQIAARAHEEPAVEEAGRFLSTGSALLNLALSDRADGGYLLGKIVNVVGDRSSGKTFKCLTALAEAAHDSAFDDYQLVFDDAEVANEFDFVKLFGQKTAERVLPPSLDRDEPQHSTTIQEFQRNITRLFNGGKPFIYILDSLDAVSTDEEIKHAAEVQKAKEAGKEAKGTYGMEKAKHASIMLRMLAGKIAKTKSLLIIISQTRDNIDPMSFQRKTRAGGKALEFYCSYEMWLAITGKLTTKINDKARTLGVTTKLKITKNKSNGKVRDIELPIYYDLGIDDVGACVDFLVAEGWWKKSGSGQIKAEELKLEAGRAKLIRMIEEREWIDRLHRITEKCWKNIENQLKLDRKPRYV